MSCECGRTCRVPDWATDGSWYNNNPGKHAHAIALAHRWFTRGRAAEVAKIRAEIRAMTPTQAFPCVVCGRHAFDRDGVTCYWCGRRRAAEGGAHG